MRATSTTGRYARLGLSAVVAACVGVALAATGGQSAIPAPASAQDSTAQFSPAAPRTWDDKAMADLELPLADPVGSPKHISADYYYRMPVRPIYKGYAIYAPGHEPPGYKTWLAEQEPQVLWGEDRNGTRHSPPLRTEADWLKAGEMVFDAPIAFSTGNDLRLLGEPAFYDTTGIVLASDGLFPFEQYV